MTILNGNSRSLIPLALAFLAAGALVSGAQEVCAQGGSEDAAMYQSLIDSLSRVEIHGFVSQGFLMSSANDYLYTTTSKGDFRFNEIGINFSAGLTEKLHVGLQLFSRSLGYVGGNQIQLDWAYADYRFRDWLGFRAGKIKSPMGMYNEIRDIDQLRTCIILPQSVYPESNRSFATGLIGLGAYGEAPLEEFGSLSYSLQGGTINTHPSETAMDHFLSSQINGAMVDTFSGLFGLPAPDGKPDMSLDYRDVEAFIDYTLSWSLFWNNPFEIDGLRIGACAQYNDRVGYSAPTTAFGVPPYLLNTLYGIPPSIVSMLFPDQTTLTLNDALLWVASLEYIYENATLAFEYRQMKATMDMGMGPGGLALDMYMEGFYLLLSYAITDSLEVGTYYSMTWPNAHYRKEAQMAVLPDHTGWQQDIALSARYDIFDFWCVKLEGHYINGTGDLLVGDSITNDDWSQANVNSLLEEDWFLGAIKTSVMF